MVDLTPAQKDVLTVEGHQLVVGGPGSGKTTVSILKAAKIACQKLKPGHRILFLSFARATVSRVFEAIDEEESVTKRKRSGSRSIPITPSSGASSRRTATWSDFRAG
ncbi:UvrD-helicase domain-containing protein [Sinorhizobium meliloti]|uniref:UvrD-helicase domain-containing protein n=1 Tax=Rhizobium meliloti TaxID=382 RepID=UPI001F15D27E|nr:UvrD-helicase domain-containing protein [Sinorhizobium meliloti]